MDNHYKTLEVKENATPDEIKKAYRRLSLKYHPDKNPGKPEMVDMFQKINAAFEVIGNPEKRAEYDNVRNNPFMRMNMGGMNMGQRDMNAFHNIDELFSNIFFGGMPGMGGMQGMGGMPGMGGIHMMHGMGDMGDMHGFPQGTNVRIFRNGVPVDIQHGFQKPTPITQTVCINMEQVLNGATIPLEIERWIIENGNKIFEKETLYVNIPKGSDDNEIIMLKEMGNIVNDNCKGDVKIFVKVENDSQFQRQGLNLLFEKSISLKESLCGFSFELKYINGKTYTINNTAGNIIVPDYQKVIPGLGLSREGHKVGNLIIHFHVHFPDKLSEEQITKLRDVL